MVRANYLDLGLLVIWLALFRACHRYCYADPSSYFFDEARAYARPHSALRESEAERFIGQAEASLDADFPPKHVTHAAAAAAAAANNDEDGDDDENDTAMDDPRICIGIPTIRRDRENFLSTAVGSLADSLTEEQRRGITLIVLLVDADPAENPFYGTRWLETIPDAVLTYGAGSTTTSTMTTRTATKTKTKTKTRRSPYRRIPTAYAPDAPRNIRARADNAALVSACRERGADYFLLVEDDVVASRDWHRKLASAIRELEKASPRGDWLFIRLFHTEIYLGWNTEEYPTYVVYIVLVWSSVVLAVMLCRQIVAPLMAGSSSNGGGAATKKHFHHHESSTATTVTPRASLPRALSVRLATWLLAFTALYFLAGRQATQPLRPGLTEMPRYGCCGQGLLFPARHLPTVEAELRRPDGALEPVDSCISRMAAETGLAQWALVPSVLQHVGVRGSSGKDAAFKRTWSFGFERAGDL
ncbi:hypothetical protein N3K66_005227 [Trichothecium roseum]|uniref:Uncharacterized protein n=1 Tax=Trichothecium roseum TaxID=47278 RepID=A0ACC0V4W5_9HYPO|nr:hypothetical protein N3K66_005227 [Trichothecium roseum]